MSYQSGAVTDVAHILLKLGRFDAANDEDGRNYLQDNPAYARSLARAYSSELGLRARPLERDVICAQDESPICKD